MGSEVLASERLRSQPPQDSPSSVPLSILDAGCARFSATGAIWVYDESPCSQEELPRCLKTSFRSALDKFPHFAGQLHWAPAKQDGDHTTRHGRAMITFGSDHDPGVEWTEIKLNRKSSDLAPDASQRAAEHKIWHGTEFPQSDLMASTTRLALSDMKNFEGLPGMLVQVTILEDGAFAVAIKMSHLLADASTLVLFVRHWAEANQTLQQGSPTNAVDLPVFDPQILDARASGDIESANADGNLIQIASSLPIHRFDWWATDAKGYPPFMVPMTENSKPTDSSILQKAAETSGKIPPWKTWDFSRPVTHAVIHFSPAQIEAMRSKVHETTQGPSRLDAILAQIWSAINRARGLGESDDEVFLNMTMGVRARVDPPLANSFVGSPLIIAHAQSTARDAANGSSAALAMSIRACVSKFTPEALGAVLHKSAHEVSPQRFWQAFLGREHILVTAWLRLGENEVDLFGNGHLPRYVHPIMPLVDGCLLVVDGGPKQGGMELSLYLDSEAMEKLLRDPVLFP
ncbi:hypothetical protein CC79DRAFT_910668 [Sarocladium strictum]